MQTYPATYKNPPIEEALVEFLFKPGQDWDFTIPGKLHQRPSIAAAYPGKPRSQKVVQATVIPGPNQERGVAMQPAVARVQLVDYTGARLLALAPDVLSVHSLRPYEGWASFWPRVSDALHQHAEVSGAVEVVRVGVRYINRVVIPLTTFKLSDYFFGHLPSPPGLPDAIGGFFYRQELAYPDGCKVVVTHSTLGQDREVSSTFLVDVDVIWEGQGTPVAPARALELVNDLHSRERAAFEALITDSTRALFDHA
jgi:uncharacterized protein (TIGR04255 family)